MVRIADHRNALSEASAKIKDLVTAGDISSRLRLREEIRRELRRIDLFPDGAPNELMRDYPIKNPEWPCFRIQFVNGAARWVLCPNKNPEGHALDQAPTLDANIPADMVPDWVKQARNGASENAELDQEVQSAGADVGALKTVVIKNGKPLPPEAMQRITREHAKNFQVKRTPKLANRPALQPASSTQMDMALHERPPRP